MHFSHFTDIVVAPLNNKFVKVMYIMKDFPNTSPSSHTDCTSYNMTSTSLLFRVWIFFSLTFHPVVSPTLKLHCWLHVPGSQDISDSYSPCENPLSTLALGDEQRKTPLPSKPLHPLGYCICFCSCFLFCLQFFILYYCIKLYFSPQNVSSKFLS